jgi:hypothetical protein
MYRKDEFIEGNGNFQIKLLFLFAVVNTKGRETNESELMRRLAESHGFPQFYCLVNIFIGICKLCFVA